VLVEVLYFDGCPNWPGTRSLVERILVDLEVDAEVVPVRVESPEAAERLRFLGSPTVRVNGRDVEPGAAERTDFALGCRVYSWEGRMSGEPEERLIRAAVLGAQRP
jgi:hypothetical protein